MELVFDESQKESDNEIWIDVYAIVRLLYRNRSEVVKTRKPKTITGYTATGRWIWTASPPAAFRIAAARTAAKPAHHPRDEPELFRWTCRDSQNAV